MAIEGTSDLAETLGLDDLGVVEVPATREALAEAIRRRIACGAYAPGERLPSERHLADVLRVGRTTIRQALRILAADGLLETTRGRYGGTFVTSTGFDPDAAQAAQRSIAEVQGNYEFRLMIEPQVAALCAERADEAHREEIARIVDQPIDSIGAYRAFDARFHVTIAAGCRNPAAMRAVQQARTEFFAWADAFWDERFSSQLPSTRESVRQHRAIARAILKGDGGEARRAMRRHLTHAGSVYEAVVAGRHPDLPTREPS